MGAKGVKPKKYKTFSNTGYKGIYFRKHINKFDATLSFHTKGGKRNGGRPVRIYLGGYNTLEEAVKIRQETLENLL